MVGGLNGLLGRESLLPRRRRAADRQQAGNIGHRKTGLAVQEEVAEQPRRIIIGADLLAEVKGRLQEGGLRDRHLGRSAKGGPSGPPFAAYEPRPIHSSPPS